LAKRIINKYLLGMIANLQCCACDNQTTKTDPHHLTHRGAGGGDVEDNLVPLCRKCHSELHQVGLGKFIDNHPVFFDIIIFKGRSDLLTRTKYALE